MGTPFSFDELLYTLKHAHGMASLHGARLPRENLVAALGHWRLHGVILATTFLVFPLLGLLLGTLPVVAPGVQAQAAKKVANA